MITAIVEQAFQYRGQWIAGRIPHYFLQFLIADYLSIRCFADEELPRLNCTDEGLFTSWGLFDPVTEQLYCH